VSAIGVSLSQALSAFVGEQVSTRDRSTSCEKVRELIRS